MLTATRATRYRLYLRVSWPVVAAAATLWLWQALASAHETIRLLLSAPTRIAAYTRDHASDILVATLTTALETGAGVAIATALGIVLASTFIVWPATRRWMSPLIVASQVIPLITLAPFFILLFGVGVGSKIAISALLGFFPIVIGLASALEAIPLNTLALLSVYGAKTSQSIRYVYAAQALPGLGSGLRVGAPLALVGAIVGEFNGADVGLGKNLYLAARRLEPELMMVSVAGSTFLGLLLYAGAAALRRFYPWHLQRSEY